MALFGAVPKEALPLEELYAAAMACIAEGVTAQKPALLAAARRHLLDVRAGTPQDRCCGCLAAL